MKSELIDNILELPEWNRFDCKRANIKPEKLLETANGFANTFGGFIALGIEDPEKGEGYDRLFGISENPDNTSAFLRLLDRSITPPIPWSSLEIDIKN